ncbi:hypothetical protein BST81_05700 [Leptolyngbya sp. 'hensonii']|uniref:hypothetical protein n=1 Tax=Leptolyngbya sp. 'hensonii' TaxID=1922337 RepID=UPI00094F4FF2|nr:hypothetical protein [Leptolyngbya sp. 'hensonii']OLP19255.1 hypothetical protein BST81_05700 [Leptolyngbya sp. 'hensonii']
MSKFCYGFWAVLLFSPMVLAQPSSFTPPPRLLFPDIGDVLDNGCQNLRSGIYWTFIWSPVPNATAYHLYVKGSNATSPVINNANIRLPEYIDKQSGSYIIDRNRLGWRWKVRAKVNGQWTAWSEERQFDVEPLNADCR